jgi:cytoskeletal protein CcmA (bactofilin family)
MADQETVIGPETRVSGELRGDEDVILRGRIEGRVQLTGAFSVEDGAIVQADVQARIVAIAGVVVGNVSASESVHLGPKARVIGDLTSPRIVIEAGAAYRGRVEMGDVELAAAAEARTTTRRAASAAATETAKAPPRLASPARAAAVGSAVVPRVPSASSVARPAAPSAPRAASAPPALPRPEAAAAGGVASAPAWAKKKLRRR